jgi:catechol 2,3-dioxygenase-like lactoylglutathione lyase family enzyme
MKYFLSFIIGLFLCITMGAQTPSRPAVWGIAKMTYLVSDFQIARNYYGRFLGFDEAFSYNSALGEVISFKVNDRQFLEFIEDPGAKNKTRLVAASFETENAEQMRSYLAYKGLEVPEKVMTDDAGNLAFRVTDPSGVPVEFIQYMPGSLHKQSKGKYLADTRISSRLHHVGLYCTEVVDNPPFYTDILGFKEMFRFPEDRNEKVFMTYYYIPDCAESIEHYPSTDPNFSHPCFLVSDMQETIYTLKERRIHEVINKPTIGKTNKWLLNLRNEDGTKVEFTEPGTTR